MADASTVRELIVALSENGRAAHSLSSAAHRGFVLLEEHTRSVFQLMNRVGDLERQVAQQRAAIETMVHLEQERQQLRRDELNLERDKMEAEVTGEVTRAERDAAVRAQAVDAMRDGARAVGSFVQTKGGLILCGMILVLMAQAVVGTGPILDLLSGLVALTHGLHVTPSQ